jgi:GDP-mannose 6-dehydrogenase
MSNSENMTISVFGLGYVGTVTAACLANEGHETIGVDISETKVEAIQCKNSPVQEERVSTLIKKGVNANLLSATLDAEEAVRNSDMAIVCVGTPSDENGALATRHIEEVSAQIGAALSGRSQTNPFLVVFRSTMLPGTMESLVIPTLEEAVGRSVGEGYDVVFHPEFLREGSSVEDFYDPPKIVIGERMSGCGNMLARLYKDFDDPLFHTSLKVAESVKYADNLFHAVKVTFANEMGQFFHNLNVDAQRVMNLFRQDTKLNISPKYLRPGFAFGGSCLPKDLRAALRASREEDLELPMLEHILPSNQVQIDRVSDHIIDMDVDRVGMYGVAFKPGTDDLRESPYVKLASRLRQEGVDVWCYDPLVEISKLAGHNRRYMKRKLPKLPEMLVESVESLAECSCIVLGHPLEQQQVDSWLKEGKEVFDLTISNNNFNHNNYHTIAGSG